MPAATRFFGPWVVRATFLMAMLGWGVGFYGPPIYLHAVMQRTGWPLALVSCAVTLHHLFGALAITGLPRAHRRFGVGPTAVAGAACTSLGVLGWSVARTPAQLFASALLSGTGWVALGAVAVNAAIAPWYVRLRPVALARAYNGASLGGVVSLPLWVWSIGRWGFTTAAALIGAATVLLVALLWRAVYRWTPEQLGQHPDGAACVPPAGAAQTHVLPMRRPAWRDRRVATLALGMAAGLFAQIGLLAHLFPLLARALGAQAAGLVMGLATACAIGGRAVVARWLNAGMNRRRGAACACAVQLAGTLLLLFAGPRETALIVCAVVLFGSGIGNATSLPPLIAQAEFRHDEVSRVVALAVATAQGTYAFAPVLFGLLLGAVQAGSGVGPRPFFAAVAAIQGLAIACYLVRQ